LGNPQGVAAQAAEKLKAAAPGVRILGTHHGFFQKTGPENDAVIAEINRVRPDVLMVGLGMPLEQRWILDNYPQVDARVFWTVGAAFQYWAGVIPRCPRWMAEHGLEWLFRLLLEPRRMAKRYLWGNAVFLIKVLQERRRLAWAARPARGKKPGE
jgi:N-acetylglucosaminyldiphosphoundecaprenol N-acetyl-beta-D-mannosaminyltransferase